MFTAQQSLAEAQGFYKSLKSRVEKFGRPADAVAVMPGFLPVIGRTSKEAAEKLAELDQWTELKSAMPLLEERIGHSLAEYDPDGPLPDLPISDQLRSRAELLTALARRENLTIRQLALRVAAGRGHHIVLGTPVDVADRMQEWFETRAADGFNVMPPFFPEGLEDFTQLVVPILQERGLFEPTIQARPCAIILVWRVRHSPRSDLVSDCYTHWLEASGSEPPALHTDARNARQGGQLVGIGQA